jgi:membrane protein YdbS with pleckstrin-like domain
MWAIVPLAITIFGKSFNAGLIMILVIILGYTIVTVVVGEIFARMAYKRWFYEFGEDGLKIERGIIWKRYSNIPYERIQNVNIRRGIIARMLGFSSLMIQTAGFSAQPQAEGYIPAIDKDLAEQTRIFVMKKITHKGK